MIKLIEPRSSVSTSCITKLCCEVKKKKKKAVCRYWARNDFQFMCPPAPPWLITALLLLGHTLCFDLWLSRGLTEC